MIIDTLQAIIPIFSILYEFLFFLQVSFPHVVWFRSETTISARKYISASETSSLEPCRDFDYLYFWSILNAQYHHHNHYQHPGLFD